MLCEKRLENEQVHSVQRGSGQLQRERSVKIKSKIKKKTDFEN